MRNLPLSFVLDGKSCLIVGSDIAALNKARLLTKGGAVIHVVTCDETGPELHDLATNSGGMVRTCVDYEALMAYLLSSNFLEAVLCVVALEDAELASQIAKLCNQSRLPVNVVDQPALCDVTFPSMVDRGSLKLSISTSGNAPVLARKIRQQLERSIPFETGALNDLALEFRQRVKMHIEDGTERRRFWESVFDGPVADMVYKGQIDAARKALDKALTEGLLDQSGEVYLVGAGPGDPELLTLKALRLMQQADIVFYDRLVSAAVLELVRRDAERVYVGKRRSNHSTSQEGINDLLLKHARAGQRVLRLKGGDPFIFGRGGEEIEHLAHHNVAFQVVPGITAASGCANYAGIPLTHRDHAQSVRFVTGHLKQGSPELPWREFTDPNQTLVFYMSLVGLQAVCENMISNGRSADTPAAMIQQGTLPSQKVIQGTLATLPELAIQHKIQPPTITIVGSVVQLREKLTWFEGNHKVE